MGTRPTHVPRSIVGAGNEDNNEKMMLVAILAAITPVGSPGEEDVAYAQVLCTGHARQVGRGVVGTLGPDLIDCSASTVGVTIVGLAGDDFLIGGQGNDIIMAGEGNDWIFSRAGDDILIGNEGKDGLW